MKSQAAMEFLMTYSFAMVVILITIAALAQFGVLNVDRFLPEKVDFGAGLVAQRFWINTEDNSLTIYVSNGIGSPITNLQMSMNCLNGSVSSTIPSLAEGKMGKIKIYCPMFENSRLKGEIVATFTTREFQRNFNKRITGSASVIVPKSICPSIMSGTGIIIDPKQICNCKDLKSINENLDQYYEVIRDIDCTFDTKHPNGESYNTGKGFDPIGNETLSFTGIFDGRRKIISDLTINRPTESKIGLFNDIKINSIVKNVHITNANITGGVYTGILAGRIMGKVNTAYVQGLVNGTDYTGGISGINYGEITQTSANAIVRGVGSVGGLVGWNDNIITNCYATTAVNGNYDVGGLVGSNDLGIISNSYSVGSITCGDTCGGLTGYNYQGTIQNSYTSSEVSGTISPISGLSGGNDAIITNCYWNNMSNNPNECYSGGNIGCTAITNNEAYFYNYAKNPVNNWNFITVWSNVYNNSRHATLQ